MTQWHTKRIGKRLIHERLDYAALQTVMWAHGVGRRDRARVLAGIQDMELAAMAELNKD